MMSAIQFTSDFLHILNPLTAFGGKSRKEYVHQVAEKVRDYAPRMSDKVGVDLTDIRVQDFRYLASETFAQSMDSDPKEFQQSPGIKTVYQILAYGVMRPISGLYAMCAEEDGVLVYSHSNSTIYVPYGPMAKLKLLASEGCYIDESAVHELTHHLWTKLGGVFRRDSRFKYWAEGFSFYGQQVWFADLYPEGYEIQYRHTDDNFGRYTIEELVQQEGEEILMRIPKEWETFDGRWGNLFS